MKYSEIKLKIIESLNKDLNRQKKNISQYSEKVISDYIGSMLSKFSINKSNDLIDDLYNDIIDEMVGSLTTNPSINNNIKKPKIKVPRKSIFSDIEKIS